MPLTITKVHDKNTRMPGSPMGGDMQMCVYDITPVDNYPGAAGEPYDFSADFIDVWHVFTAGTHGAALSLVATFEPPTTDPGNTGLVHFYGGGGGAGAPLAEIGAGPYGAVGSLRVAVIGRPSTDQG